MSGLCTVFCLGLAGACDAKAVLSRQRTCSQCRAVPAGNMPVGLLISTTSFLQQGN